jgi:hypothetical protein
MRNKDAQEEYLYEEWYDVLGAYYMATPTNCPSPQNSNIKCPYVTWRVTYHRPGNFLYRQSRGSRGCKPSTIMPRSKWISFGAQQSLERRAKAHASADANASLPSAEAKKFGLENVCFSYYVPLVTVLTFSIAKFGNTW